MKRIVYILTLMSIVVLLVSCSQKDSSKEEASNKREVSSKFDMELVEKLIGDWVGDETSSYGVEGDHKISVSNGYVYFDEKELQITDTKDNVVYTQTKEDNPFYYDFRITDTKLEVLPSYPVPKGSSGGSLAPMALVREIASTDSTLQSSFKEVYTSETTMKESNSTSTSFEPTEEPLIELGTIYYQNLDINEPIQANAQYLGCYIIDDGVTINFVPLMAATVQNLYMYTSGQGNVDYYQQFLDKAIETSNHTGRKPVSILDKEEGSVIITAVNGVITFSL